MVNKRYGMVIDLERCIGCHTCTIACKLENGFETGSGIKVHTVGGIHPDTPEGEYPTLSMHFLPILCMHCSAPPCQDACSLGAIYQRKDGIVLVDSEICDGCQACIEACPYGVLTYDEDKNVIRKCTFCVDRVDQGLDPFCMICCETEAIFFGDLLDQNSQVARMIESRAADTLKVEVATEPAIYYCPTKDGRIR